MSANLLKRHLFGLGFDQVRATDTARTFARAGSLAGMDAEPAVLMGEQEALGDDAEDATGVVKALGHLADHGDVGRDRAWEQLGRRLVPAPAELAEQGHGVDFVVHDRPGGTFLVDNVAAQNGPAGPKQAALVNRAEAVAGNVVGKNTSQEQRQVPETAQHARPFRLGYHIEQAGQVDRVQL